MEIEISEDLFPVISNRDHEVPYQAINPLVTKLIYLRINDTPPLKQFIIIAYWKSE